MQYPKKALLLWSTDVAAIAAAMGGRASGGLSWPAEAKAETYPLLVTGETVADALDEGAILI